MESNDEQAPPSSGGGSLEPAPAGPADDAAPPASVRDPETGKWVNSRDPSLVWDAAMGGWVHPLGETENSPPVFNSTTGQWVAPPVDKPNTTGTQQWAGGSPTGSSYQGEREPLFSYQTKATAAAAFIVAIALLIFAPRGNPSTDTPGVHATPTPTPSATIPGLPGDFTG